MILYLDFNDSRRFLIIIFLLIFNYIVHHNFIISDERDQWALCVQEIPRNDLFKHCALIISKTGTQEISLTVPKKDAILIDRITEAVRNYISPSMDMYYIKNPHFSKDLLTLEEKHPQSRSSIEIGIIYVKKYQSDPHDMLKNSIDDCGREFFNFIDLLGKEIENNEIGSMKNDFPIYSDKWNNIEVFYHIAPLMSEEAAELVRNDIAIVFFLEEGIFDTTLIRYGLGHTPQIFAVIQPKFNQLYQIYVIEIFHKNSLNRIHVTSYSKIKSQCHQSQNCVGFFL